MQTELALRSISIQIPDPGPAVEFYQDVWGLTKVDASRDTTFLRATGSSPYVLAIVRGNASRLRAITLSARQVEIVHDLYKRISALGIENDGPPRDLELPGEPFGFALSGPEGEPYEIVCDRKPAQPASGHDRPVKIAHAVLNARDVERCSSFLVDALGFRLSDRTRMMNFLRCNRDHHSIAYAKSNLSSVHHIAYEMEDLDAVMKGIGRMKENGYPTVWGPGRHGPGNNVFGYFIAPHGGVIEYTGEVEQVGEDYVTGGAEDWDFPGGRADHWGIAPPDREAMGRQHGVFPYAGAVQERARLSA